MLSRTQSWHRPAHAAPPPPAPSHTPACSLGTLESTKEVYEAILDLRIATPQIVLNYAAYMLENKFFEEAFRQGACWAPAHVRRPVPASHAGKLVPAHTPNPHSAPLRIHNRGAGVTSRACSAQLFPAHRPMTTSPLPHPFHHRHCRTQPCPRTPPPSKHAQTHTLVRVQGVRARHRPVQVPPRQGHLDRIPHPGTRGASRRLATCVEGWERLQGGRPPESGAAGVAPASGLCHKWLLSSLSASPPPPLSCCRAALQFVQRYGGKKVERARDLFRQAIDEAPPEESRPLFLAFAKYEEEHGLARNAMQVGAPAAPGPARRGAQAGVLGSRRELDA